MMNNKENNNALNSRVDPVLLSLRKPGETNREFIERGLKTLRDGGNPIEHEILVKLIRVFIERRLSADTITQEEGAYLEALIRTEGLA